MRVAIIRGDLPGPVFLADLETTSQRDFPVEPPGQTRYISRPTSANVEAMLAASIPATLASTGDITFPGLVINAGNQTLKVRKAATDPYTTVAVPAATYNDIGTLVTAINTVLPTDFRAVAVSTLRLGLQTSNKGTGARIQIDSAGGGSTFNTPAVLAGAGANFTVPAGATIIAATVPIGGVGMDVSVATIRTLVGTGLTAAQVAIVQEALAPQFVETDVAIKCFQVGYLADLLSANFTPDPNRIPPIATGAAVKVVQDDGTTPFVAATTALSGAVLAGSVTLAGTNLAHFDGVDLTIVKFILLDGSTRLVYQKVIETTVGGVVTPTSIVIPAAIVPAGVVAGCRVQVLYTSLASNIRTL
jgi:hypothetical protein